MTRTLILLATLLMTTVALAQTPKAVTAKTTTATTTATAKANTASAPVAQHHKQTAGTLTLAQENTRHQRRVDHLDAQQAHAKKHNDQKTLAVVDTELKTEADLHDKNVRALDAASAAVK